MLANLKQFFFMPKRYTTTTSSNKNILLRYHMIFEMIKKTYVEEKVMRCDVKSMVAAHTIHYSKCDKNKHSTGEIIGNILAFSTLILHRII